MAQYQCDVAMLPAKVIVVSHTTCYTGQAIAKPANEEFSGEKTVLALEAGAYRP